MSSLGTLTLCKEERVSGRTLIETLFNGGKSRSMSAFPLRVVYMSRPMAPGLAPVSIMVSVPKRHFKRAVKRNRVKRQVREAYRKHKDVLAAKLGQAPAQGLVLAFIWLDDNLCSSDRVEERVLGLLKRISEKL